MNDAVRKAFPGYEPIEHDRVARALESAAQREDPRFPGSDRYFLARDAYYDSGIEDEWDRILVSIGDELASEAGTPAHRFARSAIRLRRFAMEYPS